MDKYQQDAPYDYILRLLMSEFMQKRDQESLIAVLLCLRDSYVWR